MRRGARPGDWEVLPLPVSRAVLEYHRTLDPTRTARVRDGVVPQQMEDKWFIVEDRGILWFHRSWTGFCIFAVGLKPLPDGGCVLGPVEVNRDASQYGSQNAQQDIQLLDDLIDGILTH